MNTTEELIKEFRDIQTKPNTGPFSAVTAWWQTAQLAPRLIHKLEELSVKIKTLEAERDYQRGRADELAKTNRDVEATKAAYALKFLEPLIKAAREIRAFRRIAYEAWGLQEIHQWNSLTQELVTAALVLHKLPEE